MTKDGVDPLSPKEAIEMAIKEMLGASSNSEWALLWCLGCMDEAVSLTHDIHNSIKLIRDRFKKEGKTLDKFK